MMVKGKRQQLESCSIRTGVNRIWSPLAGVQRSEFMPSNDGRHHRCHELAHKGLYKELQSISAGGNWEASWIKPADLESGDCDHFSRLWREHISESVLRRVTLRRGGLKIVRSCRAEFLAECSRSLSQMTFQYCRAFGIALRVRVNLGVSGCLPALTTRKRCCSTLAQRVISPESEVPSWSFRPILFGGLNRAACPPVCSSVT